MTTLTPNQVGLLIAAADWGPGGSESAVVKFLDTAIAVAKAESGLRTNAVSPTHDYGLFQINRAAHPQYFPNGSGEMMFNPLANVVAAKKIYTDAGGWSPWSAYNSGSYRKYLGSGKSVYAYLKSPKASKDLERMKIDPDDPWNGEAKKWNDPGLDDFFEHGLDSLPSPPDIPGAIGDAVSKVVVGFKTVGVFMLAVVLLVLGVAFLMRNTKAVKAVNPLNKVKVLS